MVSFQEDFRPLSWVPAYLGEGSMLMTPPDELRTLLSRAQMAWALHEWALLLHQATTSEYAPRYLESATTVVGSLTGVQTMHDLVQIYFSPNPQLNALALSLCMDGDLFLLPHVLLGSSCALRLRQLLAQAATSDS